MNPRSTTHMEEDRDGVPQYRRRWTASTGPWASMLIVHGMGEHSGRYEDTGAYFAQEGVAVSSFDLRGFGRSGGARAYVPRWSEYVDAVEDRLAAARVNQLPVVLFGHSMGGLIALSYALTREAQPDAMVLSAPALGAEVAGWKRRLAPVLSRVLPKLRIPSDVTADQLSRDPAVGEAYFADPLVCTSTSARLGDELFKAMETTARHIHELTVPTLVLHGAADTLVPARHTEILEHLVPVSRVLLEQSHHEVFNEPDAPTVRADVLRWLRSTLGRSERAAG